MKQAFKKGLISAVIKSLINSFNKFKFHRSGQISLDNQIGRWIELLSSLENINHIVEIGTWNGRGSSRAIVSGVLKKSKINNSFIEVVGLESDLNYVHKAKKYLKKYKFFKIIYGSLVRYEELDNSELTENEMKWWHNDAMNLTNAPDVLSRIPKQIDLLILDGGEFSTYAEFHLLDNRIKQFLILDDTHTRKCKKLNEQLKKRSDYQIIFESKERNGTSVFLKR